MSSTEVDDLLRRACALRRGAAALVRRRPAIVANALVDLEEPTSPRDQPAGSVARTCRTTASNGSRGHRAPDDVDFGAAGSVARWTDAGIEVGIASSPGEAGGRTVASGRPSRRPALRRADNGRRSSACRPNVSRLSRRAADGVARLPRHQVIGARPQRVLCQSPDATTSASTRAPTTSQVMRRSAVYPDARNPSSIPNCSTRATSPGSR